MVKIDEKPRNPYLEKISESIRSLASETDAALASDTFTSYLDVMSRFHGYSLHNQILIMLQNPDATRVMGFRQWNRLNRYVRRGEKSIKILAPLVKKKQDAQTGLEARVLVGFKPVSVFDISQTDGEPLPSLDILVGGDNYDTFLAALEGCCAGYGVGLSYDKLPRDVYGVSKGGAVQVSESISVNDRAGVLVHELAHELLHRGDDRGRFSKSLKELQAESVSHVVCRHFGLLTKSCNYLALYGADSRSILDNLEVIRATSAGIIKSIEDVYKVTEAKP